jgi:putative acetyltransferase
MDRPPGGGPPPDAPPPPGVDVRAARSADARSALDLLAAVAGERRFIRTESVTPDRARRMRRAFRRSWTRDRADIVAVAGGRVVGHLGLERGQGPITEHVASLGMAVHTEWRGRGVGSSLLAEGFRWARWAGVEKLALTVYPGNEPARALYRKFGFTEEGRLVGHSRKSYGYEDEVVMGRWL